MRSVFLFKLRWCLYTIATVVITCIVGTLITLEPTLLTHVGWVALGIVNAFILFSSYSKTLYRGRLQYVYRYLDPDTELVFVTKGLLTYTVIPVYFMKYFPLYWICKVEPTWVGADSVEVKDANTWRFYTGWLQTDRYLTLEYPVRITNTLNGLPGLLPYIDSKRRLESNTEAEWVEVNYKDQIVIHYLDQGVLYNPVTKESILYDRERIFNQAHLANRLKRFKVEYPTNPSSHIVKVHLDYEYDESGCIETISYPRRNKSSNVSGML